MIDKLIEKIFISRIVKEYYVRYKWKTIRRGEKRKYLFKQMEKFSQQYSFFVIKCFVFTLLLQLGIFIRIIILYRYQTRINIHFLVIVSIVKRL